MRERALTMGYTLNEHGFSKMEGRKKGAKLVQVFADEKAIFDFLKMKYKTPVERNEASVENISESEKVVKKTNKRVTKKAVNKSDIDDFIKNGIQVLENKSEKELAKMIESRIEEISLKKGETVLELDEKKITKGTRKATAKGLNPSLELFQKGSDHKLKLALKGELGTFGWSSGGQKDLSYQENYKVLEKITKWFMSYNGCPDLYR